MHYFEIVFWAHTKERTSERVPFISTWTWGSANFFFVVWKLENMFAHLFALSYVPSRFRGNNDSLLQLAVTLMWFSGCAYVPIAYMCIIIYTLKFMFTGQFPSTQHPEWCTMMMMIYSKILSLVLHVLCVGLCVNRLNNICDAIKL